LAEEFLDGLDFGGRFDDNEVFCHALIYSKIIVS
jgi:hypothetical protein